MKMFLEVQEMQLQKTKFYAEKAAADKAKKEGLNKHDLKRTEEKEVYGELDRPYPNQVVNDIKQKFVDWDNYKMVVM